MKSLRDLLLSLLTAFLTFLQAPRAARAPRPVRGPAHPAPLEPAPGQGGMQPRGAILPPRPPPPALPPHLAALLARAPDTEPEFVRLATPLHKLAARVRIYNPRPGSPAAPAARTRPSRVSFRGRIVCAFDAITRWLARASPSMRVRADPAGGA